jgi:hypothetical protein
MRNVRGFLPRPPTFPMMNNYTLHSSLPSTRRDWSSKFLVIAFDVPPGPPTATTDFRDQKQLRELNKTKQKILYIEPTLKLRARARRRTRPACSVSLILYLALFRDIFCKISTSRRQSKKTDVAVWQPLLFRCSMSFDNYCSLFIVVVCLSVSLWILSSRRYLRNHDQHVRTPG